MKKIAYLHNLPLEYYPPATNFLDLAGEMKDSEVRVYTTANRKQRKNYANTAVEVRRSRSVDPRSHPSLRLLLSFWWHLKTAMALAWLKPDAVLYVEPHSAIAAWIYFGVLRGRARLFVHHHEYYEPQDFDRPGMRLPKLGNQLERAYLFGIAEWISQTNPDRLRLAQIGQTGVAESAWQVLPNYPPRSWLENISRPRSTVGSPLRLIYVGSASFEDTYVSEIAQWAAANANKVRLHICGYNVADDVWDWLEAESYPNVTYDSDGVNYDELPKLLSDFDIGLVLYKGNTTNFVYNVPNKVFEYLACGLKVWFPIEMVGIGNFRGQHGGPLHEVDFKALTDFRPEEIRYAEWRGNKFEFCAEQAFAPLLMRFGLGDRLGT